MSREEVGIGMPPWGGSYPVSYCASQGPAILRASAGGGGKLGGLGGKIILKPLVCSSRCLTCFAENDHFILTTTK